MPVIEGHYVVAYAYSVNFTGHDLLVAVAIAKAESNWNTDARFRSPEEDYRGLWQIDALAHPQFNANDLYDPTYCATAMQQLWASAGNRFSAFYAYSDGSYQQYMGLAQQAYDQYLSLGGSPDPPPTNDPPPPAGPVISGLYPNFGNWDPGPYIRTLGDFLHDTAAKVQGAASAMRRIIN